MILCIIPFRITSCYFISYYLISYNAIFNEIFQWVGSNTIPHPTWFFLDRNSIRHLIFQYFYSAWKVLLFWISASKAPSDVIRPTGSSFSRVKAHLRNVFYTTLYSVSSVANAGEGSQSFFSGHVDYELRNGYSLSFLPIGFL